MAGDKRRTIHGFHFVCPNELDVKPKANGTFETGIWAVAEAHLKPALVVGAYVALHKTRSAPSYRQGIFSGWRREPCPGKAIPTGVVFLVEVHNKPLRWRGGGSGEKAYWYG